MKTARIPRLPSALIVSLLAAAGVAAQVGPERFPVTGRERGLADVDGELWAVGATYKARFDAGGVLIVPPLGDRAPRSLPLRMAFESIEVGGRTLALAEPAAAPVAGEFEVSYAHGDLVRERYQVRSEALEQSFVLAELPDERGELVLRLRIQTELAGRAEGAGLFFEGAPGRGLHYGALTAIDARGRRVRGGVRLAGDALELVVAADFLADAEAPLVLDPAIGGKFDASPGSGDFRDPDLTTGASGGFFAVYERHWSATDFDVYGQEFQGNGTLVGPTVIFEPTIANVAQNPTVAASLSTPPPFVFSVAAHVAVWQQGSSPTGTQSIVTRASSPGTGALFPSAFLGSGSGSHTQPDVVRAALTPSVFGTTMVAVWQQNTAIRARYFTLEAVGAPPTLGALQVVSSGLLDTNPSVGSNNNSGSGNLVVWERWFSTPFPGDHDLVGAVISAGPVIPIPSVFVQTTVGPDELNPSVGAGMLAYNRTASLGSDDRDIFRMTYDEFDSVSPLTLGSPQLVGPTTGSDDHHPSVAAATFGSQLPIAWINGGPAVIGGDGLLGNFASAVTLGNLGCAIPIFCPPDWKLCENVHTVAGISGGLFFSELIDHIEVVPGMAVYESVDVGVFAQAIGMGTTVSTSLGGGCAGGGLSGNECPVAINSNLAHTVQGATPGSPTFLILGFDRIDVSCGSCTLVPDPYSGFVVAAGTTDAQGRAKVPMAIPNQPTLKGMVFIDQWAVVQSGAGCPSLGASFSDAREFTIQ